MNEKSPLFSDDLLPQNPQPPSTTPNKSNDLMQLFGISSHPSATPTQSSEHLSMPVPESAIEIHPSDTSPPVDNIEKAPVSETPENITKDLLYLIERDPAYQMMLRPTDPHKTLLAYAYRSILVVFILLVIMIWIMSQRIRIVGWYDAQIWYGILEAVFTFLMMMMVWGVWLWSHRLSPRWRWLMRSMIVLLAGGSLFRLLFF